MHVCHSRTVDDSCIDVVIVGAGPVGCVTSMALAQQGARVFLAEAHPQATRRLAGEWLHPPAAEYLKGLGVDRIGNGTRGSVTGRGFVVFPDDGTEAIALDYAGDAPGLSCEHRNLVEALREAAAATPNVRFVPFAHVTRVDGQQVSIESSESRATTTLLTEQVVVASGRSSLARQWTGVNSGCVTVSYAAGVVLENVELPFEGYGHVVLGGPGPALLYRLDGRRVRACLDVPLGHTNAHRAPAYLWNSYGQVLPERLRPAFRQALETRPISWAANRVRSRKDYGREGLTLVGDAVGHFHPLTAVGLTLGFGDAECLASSKSFKAYRRERASATRTAELLATALYAVFTHDNDTTLALRRAVYEMWRQNPRQCSRTMRFLSTEDTKLVHFSSTFLSVMTIALRHTAGHTVATRRWGPTGRVLEGCAAWLHWLGHAVLFTPSFPPPSSPAAGAVGQAVPL